jgi:ABC-type transport system substrate-binding protein
MKKSIWLVAILVFAGLIVCACQPEVVEKEVEVVVTELVQKEVVVTELVEKEGEQVEVTRVVKEQVIVEVTPTPPPLPEGGYVTEVSFSDAKVLNPLLSTDDPSSIVHERLFEPALDADPFTGEPIPVLVEGWEVSEDGLTYTFRVRDGIYWSDGTQVTAKDFAFTYEALKYGNLDSPRLSNVQYIDAINLIDDMTVEFVFSEVNCVALWDLGLGWLPAHMYSDYADVQDSELNTNPTAS